MSLPPLQIFEVVLRIIAIHIYITLLLLTITVIIGHKLWILPKKPHNFPTQSQKLNAPQQPFHVNLTILMYVTFIQALMRLTSMIVDLVRALLGQDRYTPLFYVFVATTVLPYATASIIYTVLLIIWSSVILQVTNRMQKIVRAARGFSIFSSVVFALLMVFIIIVVILRYTEVMSKEIYKPIWRSVMYGIVPLYILCFLINTILLVIMIVGIVLKIRNSLSRTDRKSTARLNAHNLQSLKKIGIALGFVLSTFVLMVIGSIFLFVDNGNSFYAIFLFSSIPEWMSEAAVITTFWPWKILNCGYFTRSNENVELQLQKYDTSKNSIKDTLNNPVLLKAFAEFCKKEHSEENINFWIRVEEYKKIKDRHERKQAAKKIYEECFEINSPYSVQVTEKNSLAIQETLEEDNELSRDLFNKAQIGKECFDRLIARNYDIDA